MVVRKVLNSLLPEGCHYGGQEGLVRKVLNSLLPEGGRYGGQEGFKLIVTRRWPLWWSGRF